MLSVGWSLVLSIVVLERVVVAVFVGLVIRIRVLSRSSSIQGQYVGIVGVSVVVVDGRGMLVILGTVYRKYPIWWWSELGTGPIPIRATTKC